MDNIIFGIRPVAEAIEAGKQIEKLYIRKGAEGQLMSELRDLCFRHKVRVQEVPVEKLNRLTRGNHQGVVAQISAIEYVGLADILERVGSIRNTVKLLQTEGFQIVAATEKSRKLLYDADFRKPTALVMGAEDTGISKEVLKLCDEQLAIPLIGHIESLNVSAAAAVMLFEAVRQRIAE